MTDLISTVRSVLAVTPARCIALVDGLPDELITRKPAPGEWSAVDCIKHLLDTERHVFPARVRAFLEGNDFASYDPDAEVNQSGSQTAMQIAQEYAALRIGTLALLDTLTEEDLSRKARHAVLGPVTLEEMLNEWAGHELMHIVQAERALMQPFIAKSGPWIGYFSEHVAK